MPEALMKTDSQAVQKPKDLDDVRLVYLRYDTNDVFPEATDDRRFHRDVTIGSLMGIALFCASVVSAAFSGQAALMLIPSIVLIACLKAWSRYVRTGGYLPPHARSRLLTHWAEYQDIRRRVDLHNDAFKAAHDAQKQLSEDPEMLHGLACFWEERRGALKTELDAFVGRVTSLAKQELGRKNQPSRRARIRRFRQDVNALLRLERTTSAYDAPRFQVTCDLTLLVSAAALRRKLEGEREALGLKPKALPPIASTPRKLLTACTET